MGEPSEKEIEAAARAIQKLRGDSASACVTMARAALLATAEAREAEGPYEGEVGEMRLNYEGALDDLDSALNVLIRRVRGEADLESAAEWLRLNYPTKMGLRPEPSPTPEGGGEGLSHQTKEALREIDDNQRFAHQNVGGLIVGQPPTVEGEH